MHIHVLGICGTFMGGLAQLAVAAGHRVTGADAGVYPPMSDQLAAAGIDLVEGWDPGQLEPAPDLVVIGNALTRGNPVVEAVLDRDLPYTSGPAWLSEHVLRGRHVLAVAGTHGKTTTASMLAHILAVAGREPGFLIGGVPHDFGVSARLGMGECFVIEADEYDTALFDKRSKFIHYRPRTLVLNNLEFDHADIFPDLTSIQRQFHHLVRIVPGAGRLVVNAAEPALAEVLAQGCWTPVERFLGPRAAAHEDGTQSGVDWWSDAAADGRRFCLHGPERIAVDVVWEQLGAHNVANATAAIAAARHVGVAVDTAAAALGTFGGVRRRLDERARIGDIVVYDDFAHHPTAIATTLQGLRARVGDGRIVAALDLASNSMRAGVHRAGLAQALAEADEIYLCATGELGWDPMEVANNPALENVSVLRQTDALTAALVATARAGDHILLMSNGGFGGVPAELPRRLAAASEGVRDE